MKQRITIVVAASALLVAMVVAGAVLHAHRTVPARASSVGTDEFVPARLGPAGGGEFVGPRQADAHPAPAPNQMPHIHGLIQNHRPKPGPHPIPARTAQNRAAKQKKASPKKEHHKTLKAAVLQVVTDFAKADVTVNGMPYPEYVEPGSPEGMVLPAGGPYLVQVKYDGKEKDYQLSLRPHETRLLLVDLTGYQAGPPSAPTPSHRAASHHTEKKEKGNGQSKPGKITVYSKPSGMILVDGSNKGQKTPGSVELSNGRHEVQVKYETGSTSEKKIVRVRTGSRIKLFFRERKK